MIELKNISKTFPAANKDSDPIYAVKDVNLVIQKGDIFGIIGYSGAGKSTLIRCINLLERPDEGSEVVIDGVDITQLSAKELRMKRRKIGMIFQHFNLFPSRTVIENVCYPLQYTGMSKEDMHKKAMELLDLVELTDKAFSYPSQLSGGQKQRVGIARALTTDPSILLCDEATSALDPQTTQSILALLKDLNRKLKLTIIIITHEMNVIKSICNKAAVMQNGIVEEEGTVFDIFAYPSKPITKEFIATTSMISKIYDLINEDVPVLRLQKGEILAHFNYVGEEAVEALISTASSKFDIRINIIYGDLDIVQNTPLGNLIVIISGEKESIDQAVSWIISRSVKIEIIRYG